MKRLLAILALAIAASAWADTLTEPDTGITWTYTVINGEASLGGGSSSSRAISTSTTGAITIPSTLGGYPVTSIGSSAFYNCSGLTSVTIPDGVTSIGWSAFYNCRGLTSVTIPDSVTSIGNYAFWYCSGLTSVTIPDSVTSIEENTFSGCSGLKSVTLPGNLRSIGDGAFSSCVNLTSIIIPDCVTSIEYGAFYGCSSLASVTFGNSVSSIGERAFAFCIKLTDVVIPNSVTSIGDEAFNECTGLKSLIIVNSAASIGDRAFSDCSNLENAVLGNRITAIGNYAFADCVNLLDVELPDTVTNIGYSAFSDCDSLTSVTIPDGVKTIRYGTFSGCYNLHDIIIGKGVTKVEYDVFYDCFCIKSITFKGNAPSVDEHPVTGSSPFSFPGYNECIARVPSGSTGWNVNSDGKWQGLTVEYYEVENPAPTSWYVDAVHGCDSNSGVSAFLAKATIQAAIDTALNGDTIYVSPGVYAPINTVGKSLTICSLGGAERTIIDGGHTNRCATLASDACGDWWISNGDDFDDVSGPKCLPPDPYNSKLIGFTLCNGRAYWSGHGEYYADGSKSNILPDHIANGGGAFGGVLVNCIVSNNVADLVWEAGSIFREYDDDENIYATEEIGEDDHDAEGGGVYGAKLYNCVITKNTNGRNTSSHGIDQCIAYNCTIVGNYCNVEASGGPIPLEVDNSILYNSIMGACRTIDDDAPHIAVGSLNVHNCALVMTDGEAVDHLPEFWTRNGTGHYYNDFCSGDMKFAAAANGDYRLLEGSVAINSGNACHIKEESVQYGDLSGNLRIKETVDIGAYEYGVAPEFTVVDGVLQSIKLNGTSQIVIPDDVTSIGYAALRYCHGLKHVVIIGSVTNIGDCAFEDCRGLSSVIMLHGVTSIGGSAFDWCSNLANVIFPGSVTSIGNCAFSSCSGLTSVTIPGSVTSIGNGAFAYCSGLTSVTIPDSVTSIGGGAFRYCSSLTSVSIPDSVTNIGYYTFYNCSSLTNVTMQGDAPSSIGDGAFDGVASGCTVRIPRGNETYAVSDGKWHGMMVEYYDLEPEPPVISIDEEKMEEPEDKEDGTRTIAIKVDPLEDEAEIAELVASVTISVTVGSETVDTTAGYNKTYDPASNTIVITLKEPEVGTAATEQEVAKVEGDATGMLADVNDENVELATEEPTPTEEEVASGTTEVGALPVKAVKGLYYQASWGSDLSNMRQGEKVQATGDTLYLGVIKQQATQGFYKVTVSEQ